MRARVEAGATLEQAEELRRVLEELGERLGEWGPRPRSSRGVLPTASAPTTLFSPTPQDPLRPRAVGPPRLEATSPTCA